ncbi:hypothetical protein B9Z55_015016 [Caenorhabditis nigoni]|nr:hypothetical protein B9Z55_015016 [Caenorhabditis nigoni]
MKLLISVTLILKYTNGQSERDGSFQSMCEFWHGKYNPRSNGYNSMSGDKCSIEFPEATDSKQSAKRYCEENFPFHINEAVPGKSTKCDAEATLICKSGWTQMFGRCYKLEKRMMTRGDADKHCESQKATIAFLHREALPFRINDYFTRVSSIWMDASEAITNELIHNVENGHLLLALDGFKYNLPNIALARVKLSEKAMVLCEYTPPMNQAESNYLLKRFGEIYYPTVFTSYSAFVRTSSSLSRLGNDESAHNKYCAKVMKPFIPNGMASSAVPTREFLDELAKMKIGGIVRTSAFSTNSDKSDRIKKTCKSYPTSDFHTFVLNSQNQNLYRRVEKSEWRPSQPKETCDAGTYSTGVVMSRDGEMGLETMSDARHAPIFCQTVVESYEYIGCPSGYHMYHRKELGQKWCHKFVDDSRMNYDDAQNQCQKEGAFLSGYASQDELKFLDSLMDKSAHAYEHNSHDHAYLGAKRRGECNKFGSISTPGYDRDVNSPCSRKRVFEWKNGVAPNPPDIESNWMTPNEPNNVGENEKCLVLLKGTADAYDNLRNVDRTMKLNDCDCPRRLNYFCGKEAPIVKTGN